MVIMTPLPGIVGREKGTGTAPWEVLQAQGCTNSRDVERRLGERAGKPSRIATH